MRLKLVECSSPQRFQCTQESLGRNIRWPRLPGPAIVEFSQRIDIEDRMHNPQDIPDLMNGPADAMHGL